MLEYIVPINRLAELARLQKFSERHPRPRNEPEPVTLGTGRPLPDRRSRPKPPWPKACRGICAPVACYASHAETVATLRRIARSSGIIWARRRSARLRGATPLS